MDKLTMHTFQVPYDAQQVIIVSLKSYLASNSFEVQEFPTSSGIILQARRTGFFRTVTGLSATTNIGIDRANDYFSISFSAGRWADKAIAAGLSLVVLWPLLITSAIGAYNQAELPKDIVSFLNKQVGLYFSCKGIRERTT
jgi:hypothetical protein